MLDRIEDLVTGLKTVTDSLAHDLRTPLARLRSGSNAASSPRRTPSKRHWKTRLRETETTIFAFSSLIDIARAEGGLSRDAMTKVDLPRSCATYANCFSRWPRSRRRASLEEPREEVILGHKPLLMQAVSNLVHNAIKYSPPGAQLSMELTRTGDEVRIVVADRGPGIPADKRAQAVKRFQRLGAEGDTPGGRGPGACDRGSLRAAASRDAFAGRQQSGPARSSRAARLSGKRHPHVRAAIIVEDDHVAAMGARDRARSGEPEPGAARPLLVQAHERLEHALRADRRERPGRRPRHRR